jgi:hypothetical protein
LCRSEPGYHESGNGLLAFCSLRWSRLGAQDHRCGRHRFLWVVVDRRIGTTRRRVVHIAARPRVRRPRLHRLFLAGAHQKPGPWMVRASGVRSAVGVGG